MTLNLYAISTNGDLCYLQNRALAFGRTVEFIEIERKTLEWSHLMMMPEMPCHVTLTVKKRI